MKKKSTKKQRKHDYLACSFQGGGALGAYQVGVLTALQEEGYFPDWFVGTSIGAINAAIAAGNAPQDRINKLDQFWQTISTPDLLEDALLAEDSTSRRFQHFLSAQSTLLFGQPGFFFPRFPSPNTDWYNDPRLISYYDTSPLKTTLERFVDFDRINSGQTRLSLGAVELCSGEIVYFDSEKQPIRAEHIMASGALPPGFPAIEIDGCLYWDGGISSNSPVSYVLSDLRPKALLCFMVHLFDSYGVKPTSLDEILKRKKDIEFSSRFTKLVEMHKEIHALRYRINLLSKHIPQEKKTLPELQQCLDCAWDRTVALVRFLYQGDASDLSSKDYEFSHKSVQEHIASGYRDGKKGVKASPWLSPVPETMGIHLHDLAVINNKIKELNND